MRSIRTLAVTALVAALLPAASPPASAAIVETQNLGNFSGWRAYRDRHDDNRWYCVVESFAVNRPDTDDTTLYAYPTFLAFWRAPKMRGGEEIYFQVEDIVFQFYLDVETGVAYSQDEEDFLALLALANTVARDVAVLVRDRGRVSEYVFPVRGFRDAYKIIGQGCDFDTRLLLEAS